MYLGPFLIVKAIPPSNYVIQKTKTSVPKVVHADKLKKWNGEPLASWLEKGSGDNQEAAEASEPEVQDEVVDVQDAHDTPQFVDKQDDAAGDLGDTTRDAVRTKPVRERRPPARWRDYRM